LIREDRFYVSALGTDKGVGAIIKTFADAITVGKPAIQ
jgi:hypothetical protein